MAEIATVLIDTGMRQEENARLRWEYVFDLQSGVVSRVNGEKPLPRNSKLFQAVIDDDSWPGNMYAFIGEDPIGSTPWFADGFHHAGKELIEVLRKNNATVPDTDMLPVVFLYRHAVELALKGLVWRGDEIAKSLNKAVSGSKGPQGDGHDLSSLLAYADHVITTLKLQWDSSVVPWKEAVELIADLNSVDPGSYSFRYPMRKDRSPSQAQDFGFNIFRFASLLDPVITEVIDLCHGLEDLHYDLSS